MLDGFLFDKCIVVQPLFIIYDILGIDHNIYGYLFKKPHMLGLFGSNSKCMRKSVLENDMYCSLLLAFSK